MFFSKITFTSAALIALTAARPTRPQSFLPTVKARVSDPASQQVTSSEAFTTGAGNVDAPNVTDGTGDAGSDTYTCYSGSWENYPDSSQWIDFESMFDYAQEAMLDSCANLGSNAFGAGDSSDQIQMIYNAIVEISEASLVDPRFIFAIVIQESIGCVNVGATANPDPSQPQNPGLMQSDNGVTFVGNDASASDQQASITQMIMDGTQGTASGNGLVQCINTYGNIYEAARCYNSGSVDASDLNNGEGATNAYVVDVANRMTGWLYSAALTCSS